MGGHNASIVDILLEFLDQCGGLRIGIVIGRDDKILATSIDGHASMEGALVTTVLFVEYDLVGRICEGAADVVFSIGICKHSCVSTAKAIVDVNDGHLTQLVDIGPH